MSQHTVAFIGTGANPDNPTSEGFAMAYNHADAYLELDNCRLAACADIVRENAEAFADTYDIDDDNVYQDYQVMLEEVGPDVVSCTVPPAAHAELTIGCVRHDTVEAVHCEKPMAFTWGGAQRMAREADRNDTQLTFNHQRRFGDIFREAKRLVDDGVIGDLQRTIYTWGNFYDNGTHCIDMCNYFNDETPAEWVLGGLDYRDEQVIFGTHNENQMLALWKYENGVHGMAATGAGSEFVDGDWHLQGTGGTIDIDLVENMEITVTHGRESERISFERSGDWHKRAIANAVECLDEGRPSELRAENALKATEIIFGGFESVRRRGRVDFPLTTDGNPLEEMVGSGKLNPQDGAE